MTKFISVLADNLPEVNPVVMNYKMRHNKNQPARDSLVWPDHFSVINICGGRETENMVWTCEATCKGSHGGLSHYVS